MIDLDSQATDLLSNASRLLSEQGPHALTVRRIAAAAGWSTMGVYSRFGSKNGVIDALYREGIERMQEDLVAARLHGAAVDKVRQTLVAYRDNAVAHPCHYQLVFGGVLPDFEPIPETREITSVVFADFVHAVTTAMNDGELRRGDAGDVAYSLWALCHGLVTLEISAPAGVRKDDLGRRYACALDIMLSGAAH